MWAGPSVPRVDGVGLVGDQRRRVEHFVDALGCGGRLLAHRQDLAERLDRPHQHHHQREERDEFADRERAVRNCVRAGQQHHGLHCLRDEPEQAEEARPQDRLLHRAVLDLLRRGHELGQHRFAAAVRLDDAHALRGLFDLRREVADLVLHLPRDGPVRPVELTRDERDRHETDRGEQRQSAVHRGQQADHIDERRDVDDQEHETEADEATDHGDVAVGAGEQLAGLPAIVEREVETLDVRVEVVAHHRFHLGGRIRQHQAPQEGEAAVDGADGQEQQDDRLDAWAVTVRERPVDHLLGDDRHIGGDDRPRQRGEDHEHHRPHVRPDVATDAPKRLEMHRARRLSSH